MPLDSTVIANLPMSVITELADSEHRAYCAQVALGRERDRNAELANEVANLRAIVTEVQTLARELAGCAAQIAVLPSRAGYEVISAG